MSDYEGDVEPDVVAPGAATHSIPVPPSSKFVRSQVETVEGSESLSTELAEPVPVPASPSQEETPLSGGGPGFCGSVRLSPAGFNLECPGSQTDPTTTVRGQTYTCMHCQKWNIDRARCSRRFPSDGGMKWAAPLLLVGLLQKK